MNAKSQIDIQETAVFVIAAASVLAGVMAMLALAPKPPEPAPIIRQTAEFRQQDLLFKGWAWPEGFAWQLPAPEPVLVSAPQPCAVADEPPTEERPARRHRRRRW